jgi:hypothetical protein
VGVVRFPCNCISRYGAAACNALFPLVLKGETLPRRGSRSNDCKPTVIRFQTTNTPDTTHLVSASPDRTLRLVCLHLARRPRLWIAGALDI